MAAAAADDLDVATALAEFHESGGGVRWLVESGITKVPRLFLLPDTPPPQAPPAAADDFAIPTVDLSLPRSVTAALIGAAARSCGFFNVTNHGVPAATIAAAISAARAFHELPLHERSAFYSVTPVSTVAYSTNPHPPELPNFPALPWRDTLSLCFLPPEHDLGGLPAACRDALHGYHRSLVELGKVMVALLSEALGVGAERLEEAMEVEARLMGCHYYPPCPEPARVVGGREHTDPSLFTVLVQDGVGGLQVRRRGHDAAGGEGEWVDVAPVTGALLINIGDVLKVVSNEEFRSV